MAFSASTCVTNLGGIDINSTVKIRTYPGEIQIGGDIILSAMTGVNCPYTITGIPNGTTELQIYVPGTNVCGYIDISDNDLCNTCDLGFDSFTSSTIGNIVVGNLTGSCQNPITDYRILWFGPSTTTSPRSTNVARISGKGSAFPGYNYTHPLIGSSSLPVEEGYYVPVIDKVRINGVDFSFTGGTGYVPADLECFDSVPVFVSGYTCDNGKESGNYTHRVDFRSTGNGAPPKALTSTFKLSASTNFFAWKFKGFTIPDQLKLTFYGSAYGFTPIILEWWEVGDILNFTSINQNTTTFPKSASTTGYLAKVTTLTGMTINDGDRILLEVIPSPTNPNTDWDFYFTCLETFSCDTCLDTYENQSYKISGSTITGITGSCETIRIKLYLSGCNGNEYYTTDMWKYYVGQNWYSLNQGSYQQPFSRPVEGLLYFEKFQCGQAATGSIGTCTNSDSYISFSKTNSSPGGDGVIQMYFSGAAAPTDFYKFYNSYLYWKNNPIHSGSTNNTDYSYYRYWNLPISTATGSTNCGDGTTYYPYYIHYPTAVVTTGLTSGIYSLNITMPTITKGLFPDICDLECNDWIDYRINEINNASTGTTNQRSIYSDKGASYTYPLGQVWYINTGNDDDSIYRDEGLLTTNVNGFNTIPASGISNTIIPSLSGQVCDYSTHGYFITGGYLPPISNGFYYFRQYLYQIKIELTNPLDVRDFNIYMSPINNFIYSGYPYTALYDLAYSYSGGSVVYSNPTYII
jgi:hypothetical protein